MDPRNPRHSFLEAESLISLSDKNADLQLSLDEVLQMAEAFLTSKVIDPESKFHDEFWQIAVISILLNTYIPDLHNNSCVEV